MRILTFNLSGKTAFFRMNDINDGDIVYSYGHIHKVALLGLLGAIIGLSGHNKEFLIKGNNYVHPEFYNKLETLKVGIKPNGHEGSFLRKKQNMTNGCGYIKKGNTLMYTEQWLYNVNWDIFLNLDSIEKELANKLENYIIENKAIYIPYLGKNNHQAIISNPKVVEGTINNKKDIVINSLFDTENDLISIKKNENPFDKSNLNKFDYREILPYSYTSTNCMYKKHMFSYTNKMCTVNKFTSDIINVNELNIYMI